LLEALTRWDAEIWLSFQAKWDLWHALKNRAQRPRVRALPKAPDGPGAVLQREAGGDRVDGRRAGRYTSKDVHRSVFATPPRRRTLAELKKGVRT